MDNQKFDLFLDRLLEKTEQGKFVWEKTADRNTFLLVLEDSAVSVTFDFNAGADILKADTFIVKYYIFDFRDENGDVVESLKVSTKDEKDGSFKKAERIFKLARNQSLRPHQTVDRILEQIAA